MASKFSNKTKEYIHKRLREEGIEWEAYEMLRHPARLPEGYKTPEVVFVVRTLQRVMGELQAQAEKDLLKTLGIPVGRYYGILDTEV